MDDLMAFRIGFRKLCLAKYVEYNDDRMMLYYENLKSLAYILDVLDNSVRKHYRRTQSFPLVDDLINDQKDIYETRRHANADKFGLIEGKVELSNEQMEDNRKTGKKAKYFRDRAERHGYSGLEQMKYIQKRMGWEVKSE